MKKFMKNLGEFMGWTSLLLGLVVLCNVCNGCNDHRHHYTKKTEQHVKVYKQHKHHAVSSTSVEADDEYIYWYILNYNDTYYYYSSPTYYSTAQYQGFSWSTSKANPLVEEEQEQSIEPVSDEVVANDVLGSQMEQTIDTSEQQIADMIDEGNPNSGGFETDTSTSDSSGSSGSSDSGSSGGDSGGGGDGGGGGGE